MRSKRESKIDLAIVTREPFPIGMAATNRILSYSQVLAEKNKVKIYITKPTENRAAIKNQTAEGTVNNLFFEYVHGTTIWPFEKSKFYKLKVIVGGYIKLYRKLKRDNPKTIIIYCSDVFLRILIIYFFPNSRVIIEENEYPKILKLTKSKLKQNIHLSLYSKCDGVMVMTQELNEYYKDLKVKDIFILPMTVDIKRFIEQNNQNNNYSEKQKYFTYVGGSGGVVRDSLESMIKGFNLFFNKFSAYEFHIVGPINESSESIKGIIEYIKDKELSKKVLFKGVYDSSEIPKVLQNATGIIMTPQKDFESGGFPTKLGEFLASGTPVITTDISEITNYLDNTNSYIIKPGDITEIAKQMEEIVLNPDKAINIGLEGQKVAKKHFNARTYLVDLKSFLNLSK